MPEPLEPCSSPDAQPAVRSGGDRGRGDGEKIGRKASELACGFVRARWFVVLVVLGGPGWGGVVWFGLYMCANLPALLIGRGGGGRGG